jgi:RNA-directed DNA polymerase
MGRWRRVRSNGGAAGVDAETIQAIETRAGGVSVGDSGSAEGRPISSFPGEEAVHTESRWEAAAIGDTDGKGSGVQMATKLVIEPIFEADFQPSSYGVRPKRSATQALEAIRVAGNQGYNFVVD